MLLRIVRVDCVGHICRDKEGSLDCSFKVINWHLAGLGQKLINSIKRLYDDI